MAARGQNHKNGKNKLAYAPKHKIPPPPKSSIYAVSNKRAKLDLDSALLWHYHLRHISKKRIEKLQHNGLLNSTDLRDFEKYVSCMSGKMARKPYTHQVEMAKDLLRLIHTDGCEVLVKLDTLTKPDKLEPRSIKCIFIGYLKETMGYSFYYPPENKILVARNAEFLENCLITQEASGSLEDLKIIQEEDTHPSIDTSLNHEEDDQEFDEPQSDIVLIRRSIRTRHAPDRMCLYIDAEEHKLGDLGELANYKAALLDPESDKWLNAMNVEMQSMKNNEVWVLVKLPPNGKTIGSKWVLVELPHK
nr:Gag/Pol protein [Tanacetum cinerariifolium]